MMFVCRVFNYLFVVGILDSLEFRKFILALMYNWLSNALSLVTHKSIHLHTMLGCSIGITE